MVDILDAHHRPIVRPQTFFNIFFQDSVRRVHINRVLDMNGPGIKVFLNPQNIPREESKDVLHRP